MIERKIFCLSFLAHDRSGMQKVDYDMGASRVSCAAAEERRRLERGKIE
jgi:hypothetical protein